MDESTDRALYEAPAVTAVGTFTDATEEWHNIFPEEHFSIIF